MRLGPHITFAVFPVAHCTMLALAVCWWFECNAASSVIAACGIAICVAATVSVGRALGLWVHGTILIHLLLGMRLGWYDSVAVYDEIVHACTIMLLVLIAVNRIGSATDLRPLLATAGRRLLLSGGLALAFGSAWELFEFALDALFQLRAQTGLRDTNLDLAADLLGGIGAFVIMAALRSAESTQAGKPHHEHPVVTT